MAKSKADSKSIDMKSVTSSPYFTAALLVVIIVAIIALIVYFMSGIKKTKTEIQSARTELAENRKAVQELDMLRARSEEAEKELAQYEGILPSSLGDGFKLQDKIYNECLEAGLNVTSFEISQLQSATYETVITMDVNGKFTDIHNFLSKFAHQKQIQRIDTLTLTKMDDGNYDAVATLTLLSTEGAQYLATEGIVDDAIAQVAEAASTDEG